MKTLLRFSKNESGATAIEYGLIASLIGLAIIGGVTAAGTSLDAFFERLSDRFDQQLVEEPADPPANN